jgi:hypothetical protein
MSPELRDYFEYFCLPIGGKDLFEMCENDPELRDLLDEATPEGITELLEGTTRRKGRRPHSNRPLS